ncbi:hypothetical protein, partial [Acinetobacter baumannii]|uniref:hypothetical protein n=1 Tax=Acinetobacter baumannii TaxID=470 RepID=UPI003391B60D
EIHKTTRISPDGKSANQIDHFAISRKWRKSHLDVRAWRGADAASDQQLLIATMRTKLRATAAITKGQHQKFNTRYLSDSTFKEEFLCAADEKFNALPDMLHKPVETHWRDLQQVWVNTCRDVLGKKERNHKEWLTPSTWALINQRRELKQKLHQ